MSTKHPEFHTSEETEYGLLLPNGEEIWPPNLFHGTGLTEPQERASIVEALKAAAINLGVEVEELLEQYQWIVRYRRYYVTVDFSEGHNVPITSTGIISFTMPETVGTDTEDLVYGETSEGRVPDPSN